MHSTALCVAGIVLFGLTMINSSDNPSDSTCQRHRKSWYSMSDHERSLFVNGFKELRSNGVLSAFATTHHLEGIAFSDIHKTSEFFFWHNYFVWEFETQIRNLGGEYECFAMPYWDFTVDSNTAMTMDNDDNADFSTLPLFNNMMGGVGNADNNYCVEDDIWNVNEYQTEFLCANDESPPNCCLKREIQTAGGALSITDWIADIDTVSDAIQLRRFRSFQDALSLIHGKLHKFIADSDTAHMYSVNAAEDPLFVLLHSFIVYLRAMRTTCNGFDAIDVNDLEEYIPFAFDSYVITTGESDDSNNPDVKPRLDTAMGFAYICELDGALCAEQDITPRLMYDISDWGITYELGDFWERSNLQDWCMDNLNEEWFFNENVNEIDAEGLKYAFAKNEKIISNNNTNIHSQHSLFALAIYCVIGIIFLFITLFSMIKKYSINENDTKQSGKLFEFNSDHNIVYGSL